MKYGDVYWANPDPAVGSEQDGRRPVLIISADEAIEILHSVVTTIPLTMRSRPWAVHVEVSGPETGLLEPTWAMCEQVRTVSSDRLGKRVGRVDAETLRRVSTILRHLLNLE